MVAIEHIASLLNESLDATTIEAMVGHPGRELPSSHDAGHPEDERHYYVVPQIGLQLLAGPDRRIRALFFMFEADANVQGYPWTLKDSVGPASTRDDVCAELGNPEKSASPLGRDSWDRFAYPPHGYLHVQYSRDSGKVRMITLMRHAP